MDDNTELLNTGQVEVLLDWFDRYGVDYPWAGTRDPWAIWVSEVMLQQTTVSAVKSRYLRWMERYPTPGHLAETGEDEYLRDWEGLGYYNRARNLASAAGEIVLRFGGRVPRSYDDLRSLPGIGDYIASALSSFAFNERHAAIDANGRRIAQRLTGLERWDKSVENRFRKAVESRMPTEEPGRLNAAVMQLGQLICLPRSPRCGECPLGESCRARAQGRQDEIPLRKKKTIVELRTPIAVLMDDCRILLQQRRSGIARGMWVFPSRAEIPDLERDWENVSNLPVTIHAYTRYREHLEPGIFIPKRADSSGFRIPGGGKWVGLEELHELPMPTAYRKIARQLANHFPLPCVPGV
jgi:A/G-specific adenine glycosylase